MHTHKHTLINCQSPSDVKCRKTSVPIVNSSDGWTDRTCAHKWHTQNSGCKTMDHLHIALQAIAGGIGGKCEIHALTYCVQSVRWTPRIWRAWDGLRGKGEGDREFRGQCDMSFNTLSSDYGNLICSQVSVLLGSLHSNSTLISYAGF